MTTFIKPKLKKSHDQTNITKYRVAAIFQNIIFDYVIILHRLISRDKLTFYDLNIEML